MKNLMLYLVLGLSLASCDYKSPSPETVETTGYAKEGLSFDLPKYWEVAEDSKMEVGRYVEIENKEPLGSGLVVMSIFDEKQDNAEVVEMMNNKYRRIFSEQNIQYELLDQPHEVTIGNIKATEGNGQIQMLGEKEQIRILVFDLPNQKTVCFALTSNSDDMKENKIFSEKILTSMKME